MLTNLQCRIFAVVFAALLFGCSAAPLHEEFERNEVSLVTHVLPRENVRAVCADLSGDLKLMARGCARFSPGVPTCDIFIPEPRNQDDATAFTTIGHEVWHCLRGRFHDAPG